MSLYKLTTSEISMKMPIDYGDSVSQSEAEQFINTYFYPTARIGTRYDTRDELYYYIASYKLLPNEKSKEYDIVGNEIYFRIQLIIETTISPNGHGTALNDYGLSNRDTEDISKTAIKYICNNEASLYGCKYLTVKNIEKLQ